MSQSANPHSKTLDVVLEHSFWLLKRPYYPVVGFFWEASMKLFTFSKRWKMRGDALVNEVCYYAKRDIAAGEELLCFDGRWVGLPVATELAPTTSTLKLPCDAENPRISYGKTWWSSRGIHDATAAPQTQLLLPSSSVAGEWFWMVFWNAGDHEFHDDDTMITVIITMMWWQQYILRWSQMLAI